MEYFIIENNGLQAGPFSLEQLVQKAITPETLVWAQGMKDWTPAWKIAELKTVLETVEAIKANTAKQRKCRSNISRCSRQQRDRSSKLSGCKPAGFPAGTAGSLPARLSARRSNEPGLQTGTGKEKIEQDPLENHLRSYRTSLPGFRHNQSRT